MIARNIVLFCFLVGNLTIAPRPDALAAGKAATAPGTYRDWNGDMFGGGYQELFTRTAHQMGGDIATLINAF